MIGRPVPDAYHDDVWAGPISTARLAPLVIGHFVAKRGNPSVMVNHAALKSTKM
jgi:hypothetical protein